MTDWSDFLVFVLRGAAVLALLAILGPLVELTEGQISTTQFWIAAAALAGGALGVSALAEIIAQAARAAAALQHLVRLADKADRNELRGPEPAAMRARGRVGGTASDRHARQKAEEAALAEKWEADQLSPRRN